MSGSFGAAVNGNYPAQNGMGYDATLGAYVLGGDLTRPTILNTDLVNVLRVTGLQAGDPSTDSLAVIAPDGTVKFISVTGLPDFWRQVVTGALPDGTTDTDDAIRHLGSIGIGGAAATDAMPTVTTPAAVNSYLHLSPSAAHRGQIMFGSNPLSYYMERRLPTAVNDYVDIGSFTSPSQASAFALTVNVSDGGFAASKCYLAALNWHATAGAWRVLKPVSDGGAFGANNYELLANVNNGVTSLRLRRTSGNTAGTARIYLQSFGRYDTALTESVAGGTDATVYAQLDMVQANDFWRSGTGATLPDGVTDTKDAITHNGNVGVGLTDPTTIRGKVHVNGANANGAAGTPLLRLTDTNIANSYWAVDNGAAANAYRIIASGPNLELQAGGLGTQITVSANGGVGIGTNAPTAGIGNISAAVNGLKPGGGAWGAFSDRRVKKNIRPVGYGLAEILQLDPIAFQYNGKAGTIDDDRTHYSLVAQDVMGILPDFIEKHPIDGEVFDSMSASDQSAFADGVVLGLREGLTNFEALLINAIKELAAQNKILVERVTALEGKK